MARLLNPKDLQILHRKHRTTDALSSQMERLRFWGLGSSSSSSSNDNRVDIPSAQVAAVMLALQAVGTLVSIPRCFEARQLPKP